MSNYQQNDTILASKTKKGITQASETLDVMNDLPITQFTTTQHFLVHTCVSCERVNISGATV